MPRRKVAREPKVIELLPPEENDQPKVREIKHKTEWIEVAPVEETSEGDDGLEEGEIEDKPRKRNKNAIQEMRKRLRAQGVTPSSNLRLYIERYVHSETDAGGSWAETEFCTKYQTTEEHIVSKDYIDAARKWGPGKYRITIRMDNRIVDAFDERISATPTGPVIQNVNPNDPASPQFIIQTNGDGQQQPMSMRDIMKAQKEAFKEQLEMAKLMREAYGLTPEATTPPPRSEEEILSSAILKQPEVIENVVGSLIKRFGGKGSHDDEPWYAEPIKEAIRNGQASEIAAVIVREVMAPILAPFRNLWGGQNNGQTQVAETQFPQGQQTGGQVQNSQTRQEALVDIQQGHEAGALSDTQPEISNQAGNQQTSPEEQALQLLIEHCRRGIPAEIACDRLISFADAVNDQAPHLSIDRYISIFASMPVEAAIEFVKSQPNGEQVASLPHARQWTAELQGLIKEAGQEGEEE